MISLKADIDGVDRKIMTILQDDARTTVAELARRLGLGETTIRYRIDKLRKDGVITGFMALLNPRKIGYLVAAIILVRVEARHLGRVFEAIAGYDETFHVIQTTGEYDMVTVVHTRDMPQLNTLANRVRSLTGVKEASVWIATALLKINPKFKL